jgi:hypothetical protein
MMIFEFLVGSKLRRALAPGAKQPVRKNVSALTPLRRWRDLVRCALRETLNVTALC